MRKLPEAAAYLLIAAVVAIAVPTAAQVPIPIGATPTPTPTSRPATPRPSPSPSGSPAPSPIPSPPAVAPTATPLPSGHPGDTPLPLETPSPPDAEPVVLGPQVPPGFHIPVIARTPGRSTVKLVRLLERVTEIGMPVQQALLEGMGRFPVAGVAFYSDDWMNPRYTPVFHLHEGLDIFAEFGTPIRSPDRGIVSRLSDGPVGGTAVWLTSRDGTQYYFAHMQERAPGLVAGMQVEIGTVIGFVGDSGNARGGAPHLHMEIHRGGALPPKPIVDGWLADAEDRAPTWVDAKIRTVLTERAFLRSEHTLAGLMAKDTTRPAGTPEYSILLTLLDPIGGSVGLLPDVSMVPPAPQQGSTRLMDELIRLRVDGSLIRTLVSGFGTHTDAG